MIDTLSNPGLERELFVSKILNQIPVPSSFSKLSVMLSEIPYVDTSIIFPLSYPKNLVDKFGMLKEDEVKKFYVGKNKKLFGELEMLHQEVIEIIPLYEIKIADEFENAVSEIASSPMGTQFENISFTIASNQYRQADLQSLDNQKVQLQKMAASLGNIIAMYGSGEPFTDKRVKALKFNSQYQLYLQFLTENSDVFLEDPTIAVTLGNAMNALSSVAPQPDNLDPFNQELADNLLSVLINPEDFYKKCKLDEIISPNVGSFFGQCYPEFYHKFLDMYLDDYDKMTYQEQINFRKCFGIQEDNPQLLNLCDAYINMNFNAQGA